MVRPAITLNLGLEPCWLWLQPSLEDIRVWFVCR